MATENNKKIKTKKPTVIVLEKTSPLIFVVPTFAFILLFIYSLHNSEGSLFFIYMMCGLIIFLPAILQFFGKKYVLTDKKFYFYEKNKKVFSGTLLEDFNLIDFQQTLIGKILNYGTLILVKNDKSYYSYSYLNNVENVYEKTILQYEKLILEINPDFEAPFTNKKNHKNIDSLDNIDNINNSSNLDSSLSENNQKKITMDKQEL